MLTLKCNNNYHKVIKGGNALNCKQHLLSLYLGSCRWLWPPPQTKWPRTLLWEPKGVSQFQSPSFERKSLFSHMQEPMLIMYNVNHAYMTCLYSTIKGLRGKAHFRVFIKLWLRMWTSPVMILKIDSFTLSFSGEFPRQVLYLFSYWSLLQWSSFFLGYHQNTREQNASLAGVCIKSSSQSTGYFDKLPNMSPEKAK